MDNYFTFDPEYSALDDAGKDAFVARYNKKKGGRVGYKDGGGGVGYATGSPHFDPPTFSEGVPQMFISDTLGALPKAEGGVRSEDMGILSVDDFNSLEDYRRYMKKLKGDQGGGGEKPSAVEAIMGGDATDSMKVNAIRKLLKEGMGTIAIAKKLGVDLEVVNDVADFMKYGGARVPIEKAKGGRVSGYGGGITANMPRISMGIPRVNAGGIRELDYRATGGFVPVGVKEKADDVPAMLSKNEFVMTANAVKGAGGGSVEKGAQRMYNTMKKLEGRVA
jgi:hypothetical protein